MSAYISPPPEIEIRRPKILLADDNTDLLTLLKNLLERQGFEVVPVTSVASALNHIVSEHFDVLITDLHMPDAGDGFTVIAAMRQSQPEALTMVLSGVHDVTIMGTILLQADEVVAKSFDYQKLADLIRRKIQERKSSRKSVRFADKK